MILTLKENNDKLQGGDMFKSVQYSEEKNRDVNKNPNAISGYFFQDFSLLKKNIRAFLDLTKTQKYL